MKTLMLSFNLNGQDISIDVTPESLLVDLLREKLGLTATKAGCRAGECGSCSVLLDGEPVNSCLVPSMKVMGRRVVTLEGLCKSEGKLDELQEAFINEGAIQCGFCTPGMIMNARSLLTRSPEPDEIEIKQAISGVLCRCTGYRKIVQAIRTVSEAKKSS